MTFIRCSACEQRSPGKINHVYWFAPLKDGSVFRVRQRLCAGCLAVNVLSLLALPDAETLTCPACGISVEDDVNAVYVTYYMGGGAAERGAMSLCTQHFYDVYTRAQMGALELPDRFVEPPDQIVASAISASDTFRAVGRVDPMKNARAVYLQPRLDVTDGLGLDK